MMNYQDFLRIRSPKSVASPADAIVTKSITLDFAEGAILPPMNTPRVGLETPSLCSSNS